MKRILVDIKQDQQHPTEIYCDNKATISMTKNPFFHRRTEHNELCHHFIRDVVIEGEIVMKYCPTTE
ncbi:hypothetical protein Pint_32950 [Pistacia integerrima]|uniref:Uncharacterized protein n=1 Tax=Pistacia integerrima TaxID=434235 RepID=A0ACC0X5V1_9ROSI|nr:hypothetical protein Pint_32950 [Pistacia integerrima]